MGTSLFILAVIFMTIVAPLWIIFHYVTIWKERRGLTTEDERLLQQLWDIARKMEQRIDNLEKVLETSGTGRQK